MGVKDILLILPDERRVYENVNVKVGAFHLPSLSLAILGAIAKENGFHPEILDLSLHASADEALAGTLARLKPTYAGITCTTATYFLALENARFIKERSTDTKVLIGGPHASSTVSETLRAGCFDYIFIGESEISFSRFLRGNDPREIEGIAFMENGEERITPNKSFLKDLDAFPYPDYGLFDLTQYPISRLHSRRNPVVWIETSRGCPFDCKICNKIVHGRNFRPKSTKRILDEMDHFVKMGIREFHISDDGFTSNMNRAREICEGIIERKLDITWSCVNGIRVDRVNAELLKMMRLAGCYRISFGIESGNQGVLDTLGKKTTIAQIRDAVYNAKAAGIEVFGFFMFGFMDDTESTMRDTIDFAKSLPLDLAKASLIIPFPGSPLHAIYSAEGLCSPPGDYRHYNVYASPKYVYSHPSLEWDVIEKYQKRFYREFYLNPRYMLRRALSSIRNKTLFADMKAALSFNWFSGG